MMQTHPVDPRSLVDRARESEQRGDTSTSLGLYEEAIEFLGDESDLALLADALRWKGTLHREQGETEAAYRCYKKSLSYAVRCGSVSSKAHCYNCLAIVAQRRGHLNECERLYMHAANLASKAGDIRLLGIVEHNRGVLMNMQGKLAAAEARYARSLRAFEKGENERLSVVGCSTTSESSTPSLATTSVQWRHGEGPEIAQGETGRGRREHHHDQSRRSLVASESSTRQKRPARFRSRRRGVAAITSQCGGVECRARIEREGANSAPASPACVSGLAEAKALRISVLRPRLLRELGQTPALSGILGCASRVARGSRFLSRGRCST